MGSALIGSPNSRYPGKRGAALSRRKFGATDVRSSSVHQGKAAVHREARHFQVKGGNPGIALM